MKGIIGKKVGMTSIFDPSGKQTACTIIEAGPCVVTQVKTKESDGYNALQLSYGEKKEKNATKAAVNHFSKAQTTAKRFSKEFRDFSLEKSLGETVTVDIFAEGETIEVVGTTKGKGFQGVVKRHGFSGVGMQTHGQHDRLRAPGSIGAGTDPGHVFKNTRMAGRMGGRRVTVMNLSVVEIISDRNLLLVRGSVPGAKNGLVMVRRAVKGK